MAILACIFSYLQLRTERVILRLLGIPPAIKARFSITTGHLRMLNHVVWLAFHVTMKQERQTFATVTFNTPRYQMPKPIIRSQQATCSSTLTITDIKGIVVSVFWAMYRQLRQFCYAGERMLVNNIVFNACQQSRLTAKISEHKSLLDLLPRMC